MQCVVIGDVNRSEFGAVLETLRDHSETRAFSGLREYRQWLAERRTPEEPVAPVLDLLVILHGFSGEHHQSELDAITVTYPLTPVVSVLGSWCEGEQRTGTPLHCTHRIYWYDWFSQGHEAFLNWKKGVFSRFNLPANMKEEEITLELARRRESAPSSSAVVKPCAWVVSEKRLSSEDPTMTRLLLDILQSQGFAPQFHEGFRGFPKSDSTEFVLWDLGPEPVEQAARYLKPLRQRIPYARIVALCMSPRVEERNLLLHEGVDFVLAKPFALHELCRILDEGREQKSEREA